jgi:DNA invertase Pin-like site-specific DNA recombinase
MEEKRIICIDAKPIIPIVNGMPVIQKKRVCAYARVSTDSEDQLNSYNAQIREYTQRINENPAWEFKGMYADEGVSGTGMKKRLEFQKMLADARKKNIDLILTKSMSRFARNTIDCLTIVNELRQLNIEVFFEKENLYSSDPKVDFMITIFSSIAQEEARNMSDNIKWGFRKRCKEGKVRINTSRFLGYGKDQNDKIVIDPEEAKVVKMIFNMYIAGLSPRDIAGRLTDENIVNGRGVVFWKPATIVSILTNEKYCGDAILQKRITVDYLTHKSVTNTGQAPKYYIMNNHEPIIPREMFEVIQQLKKERGAQLESSRFANIYPLSGMIYCGNCHRPFNRHYYHSVPGVNQIVLTCKNNAVNKVDCDAKPLNNSAMEKACCYAIRTLEAFDPELMPFMMNCIEKNLSSAETFRQITEKKELLANIEDQIRELINVRISATSDEDETYFRSAFKEKKAEADGLKREIGKLQTDLAGNHQNADRLQVLRDFLANADSILSREALNSVFKRIIVTGSNEVVFCICKTAFENTAFINAIDRIKDYEPVLASTYSDDESGKTITYKIVEFGDEIYDL